ncbi:GTP cyclohydrolase II [Candidatus Spongiihabitans sp.]|uniref:GTP cyclohydrolase II n=1 Tax=Candidatus Spongiihabitans sp. TaxID=3101308 RepID=UPI003C6F0E67
MFTYLKPDVRERLVAAGKLVRISGDGSCIDNENSTDEDALIINLLGPIPLPLRLAGNSYQVNWYAAVRSTELEKVEGLAAALRKSGGQNLFADLAPSMAVNSAVVIGNPENLENPLVRVHSNCLTGDVFGSQRCECGAQLASAVSRIADDPSGGIIIYMAGHEGRGIGLWAKAATYLLQDAGENTYQANQSLGLPADSRDFTDAAALILYFLGNRPMRLLTNNPKKIDDLSSAGLTQMTTQGHVAGVSKWNKRYLSAKQSWGHKISDSDIAT